MDGWENARRERGAGSTWELRRRMAYASLTSGSMLMLRNANSADFKFYKSLKPQKGRICDENPTSHLLSPTAKNGVEDSLRAIKARKPRSDQCQLEEWNVKETPPLSWFCTTK